MRAVTYILDDGSSGNLILQAMSTRQNFSQTTVAQIGKAAMYICANPQCLRFTGYETSKGRPRSLAEAAHLAAAAENGPRAAELSGIVDLKSASNGIWLCLTCHQRIDDDPDDYPISKLKAWKDQQGRIVRSIVGKDLEAAILALGKERRGHQECQDLLSFLESRRVLYEGLDSEFPPRVLESLNMIRERVVQTRVKVPVDSDVFIALRGIQIVVDSFLRNIGPATDLRELRCDGNDPVWRKFASELQDLRLAIVVIMKVVAQNADYKLSWV